MQGKVDIKKALTVAFAVAAFAAPAAQADPPQLQRLEDQAAAQISDASDREGTSDALRQFLVNDDRHSGTTDASDRAVPGGVGARLRDYDAFRVPQSPVSVGEPRGGIDWPAMVAGASLLVLLAGFGITAIAGVRSRSRVAHS